MDGSPSTIAKFLVPKIPFIFKTVLFHSLWLSSTSTKWDLRTELTIKIIREMLNGQPWSISKQQKGTLKDPGVKGRMWISRVTMPAPPEDDLRQALFKAIDDMKEGDETYTRPTLEPVEAEWTGYRANVAKDAPEPSISEEEKYQNLMKEVTSDVTILYFHGGAYYLMDPASHRQATSRYAHLTGGRACSVRYRLAPQNPFPAALLDALVSYLSLLYPPPGALHEPVKPSHIVFAGDSAGAHLCASLLQLLLQLHRSSPDRTPTVTFHGRDVELPLPAGLALNSPWLDITRALPSIENNAQYDYLPPPSKSADVKFPPCPLWPTDPPRTELYCDGSAMCHPLVSPLAAKSWAGSPPIFVVCGEEMLADEGKVFAQRAARQGVKVVWEQYEAMPHCFALMLEGLQGGRMCVASYCKFIRDVVREPESVKTEGYFVTAKKLERKPVDVEKLTELTDEEVARLMDEVKKRKILGLEGEGKAQPRL
ncbi:hypothetical protein H2201_001789 [Coniosporium apollinis]|uniref:Alpha/beta hydrolase fold-3 domain-containing protein n=1 Tax=Coniosporium apollinis TaxID=61459 RepID=A0ABQ9P359_9PEZI|nr:hypothetical protein H2201_001789 [Coniosporium apollinis]